MNDAFVVDKREPAVVSELMKKFAGGRGVQVDLLDVGDIRGSVFVAERKSIPDLVSSKKEGRLDRQLFRLSLWADDHGMVPVLLLHGLISDVANYARGAHAMIPGIVASSAVRYGVQVVWLPTLSEALRVFVSMDNKGSQEGRPRIRGRTSSPEAILAAYFGLPLKTAMEIQRRGGIAWLVDASDEELLSIKGIGRKRLERIRRLISHVAPTHD